MGDSITAKAEPRPGEAGAPTSRLDLPATSAFVVPFALVLYLALSDGGYDPLVWGEVGVLIWWVVLLAAVVGLLSLAGLGRPGWAPLAALTAFAVWTALAISWAESSERAVAEAARVATYLGVFLLAAGLAARGYARQIAGGLAAAIAVVAGLALLSRLQPAWFTPDEGAAFISERNRLDYPFNYFNAVAAFLALGLPLLLSFASSARTLVVRALAAASLPIVALALFFTLSRGGALAAVVGLAAFLTLARDRVPKLASLIVAGLGSAVLIAAANEREALTDGLRTAAARNQGDEVLVLVIGVCLAVALAQVAMSVVRRRGRWPSWLEISPRAGSGLVAGVVVAGVVVFLAAGGVGEASDRWREFKRPQLETAEQRGPGRLALVGGRGRYQMWQSAVDANETHPWRGIGPGGFELWWARKGKLSKFVRDAHSLYLETLAEVGIVGLAILASFFVLLLGGGALRALRDPGEGALLAAATGGCAAFSISAGIDWMWEIAVLPVAFLGLAAIAVAGRSAAGAPAVPRPALARAGIAALALAALVAIGPPLVAAAAIRDSEDHVAGGRLDAALDEARTAERAQPYAATPKLQRALILERAGRLDPAADAARRATEAERTNWRTWLVRSRIEARRGQARAAASAYRRARSLNPRSQLFLPR